MRVRRCEGLITRGLAVGRGCESVRGLELGSWSARRSYSGTCDCEGIIKYLLVSIRLLVTVGVFVRIRAFVSIRVLGYLSVSVYLSVFGY